MESTLILNNLPLYIDWFIWDVNHWFLILRYYLQLKPIKEEALAHFIYFLLFSKAESFTSSFTFLHLNLPLIARRSEQDILTLEHFK